MTSIAHDQCAQRFARRLSETFPTAKHLARAADCHPDTAADLMRTDAPRLPSGRIMVNLARALGPEFVAWVYAPATGWTDENDMNRKLRAAEDALAEVRRSIVSGLPAHMAPEGGSSDPTSSRREAAPVELPGAD